MFNIEELLTPITDKLNSEGLLIDTEEDLCREYNNMVNVVDVSVKACIDKRRVNGTEVERLLNRNIGLSVQYESTIKLLEYIIQELVSNREALLQAEESEKEEHPVWAILDRSVYGWASDVECMEYLYDSIRMIQSTDIKDIKRVQEICRHCASIETRLYSMKDILSCLVRSKSLDDSCDDIRFLRAFVGMYGKYAEHYIFCLIQHPEDVKVIEDSCKGEE